ncbi:MAG: ATP-dependent DNA ligase [Betaproteobacteria bacterium]
MKCFARLYATLDASTRTNDKVAALVDYFRESTAADACWAVYFLTGNRPRQAVPAKKLHQWAAEAAGLPLWLFEESYDAVGDLAETIALILPPPVQATDQPLHTWIIERLLPLRKLDESLQRDTLLAYWHELDAGERFVFNKLITGSFRVGVSGLLVMRALSQVSGLDAKVIAHRMAGDWGPTPDNYEKLISQEDSAFDVSKPYPFFLAHPVEGNADALTTALGEVSQWQAEWKWDGIRGQLVKRPGGVFLWSRGEELISEQFPEIVAAGAALPDCVLDGEVLPAKDGKILPFNALQKRLGRKNPGKKIMADTPAIFLTYDLLELEGEDWRTRPLHERRAKLHELVHSIPLNPDHPAVLQLSDIVRAPSWTTLALAREESRSRGTEGLMLKRRDSPYGVGRTRGDWWKWKIDPLTVDCVLMYAQRGHGKRASLYSDYTFGVWNSSAGAPSGAEMAGEPRQLVTFAKAYSGLSNEEIAEVDAFIRKNTLEKFGPVRTVKPELVFELAFEGIQRSKRHKSGVAVRFPRMLRIRRDKKIADADSLDTILALLDTISA